MKKWHKLIKFINEIRLLDYILYMLIIYLLVYWVDFSKDRLFICLEIIVFMIVSDTWRYNEYLKERRNKKRNKLKGCVNNERKAIKK